MIVLVTGASGFVGGALCEKLATEGIIVRGVSGRALARQENHELISVGNISAETNWSPALDSVEYVVHLAARVHVMSERCEEWGSEYFRVNVGGTANLAQQAARAGVRRFVYVSSVKVNGESTKIGVPFTSEDIPMPDDPYAASKYEAERELFRIARNSKMEVVIIRPPLVYGPGVRANFLSMMRWLSRGLPLPFSAIRSNKRSLVALENLVSLISLCLRHPRAANEIFLVSDGEDVSTADLLERLGQALGRPARLFYAPPSLMKFGSILLNNPGIYHRLCGSLQLDITKTQKLLGWTPSLSIDEGLRLTAQWFSNETFV